MGPSAGRLRSSRTPAGDAGESALEASRRRNESEKAVDLVGNLPGEPR